MTTTIYYNFPEINLDLNGAKLSNKIYIPSRIGQPISNIQFNNKNFSAHHIYITGSSTQNDKPNYLIVECFEDSGSSNKIFVVFPFVENNGDPSDVDNIIKSKNGTVKFNLNKYIKPESKCFFKNPESSIFPVTITLDSKSQIPIKQHVGETFYTLTEIDSLSLHDGSDNNATLQQQDLDWIMSCELLTEDGPEEKTQVDPGTTATTISLFMMAIMISGATYVSAPILYKEFGMYRLAMEVLDGNHYSINIFWLLTLLLLALTCLGNGIKSNNHVYLFITIAVMLSYFSGTSAMTKVEGVGTADNTRIDKKENQSIFAVYYAIIFGDCETWTGTLSKWVIAFGFVFSYLVMAGSAATGSHMAFVSNMILFLIFAVALLRMMLYVNKKSNPTP